MAAPKAHVCILVAASVLYGATARAHHSFGAEYDSQRPVTVTGVVTKIEWTNPHCHFYVDVVDEHGTAVNWKFEGYGIGPLYRNGWKRDVTMKAGLTPARFERAHGLLAPGGRLCRNFPRLLRPGPPIRADRASHRDRDDHRHDGRDEGLEHRHDARSRG